MKAMMKKTITVQRGFPALTAAACSVQRGITALAASFTPAAALIAGVLLVGSVLTGCTNEEQAWGGPGSQGAIGVTATIGGSEAGGGASVTRATGYHADVIENQSGQQFTAGINVDLFLTGARQADGSAYTDNTLFYLKSTTGATGTTRQFQWYSDAARTASTTAYWPLDAASSVTFRGYYPAGLVTTYGTATGTLTIATAQGAASAPTMTDASSNTYNADMLYTEKTTTPMDTDVPLVFQHLLSRVTVTLVTGNGYLGTAASSRVDLNGVKNQFTVTNAAATATGSATNITVKNTDNSALENYCILPPQALSANAASIVITDNLDQQFTYNLPATTYAAGKDYHYTFILEGHTLTLMSLMVTPWVTVSKSDADLTIFDDMRLRPLTITNTSGGENTISFRQNSVATSAVKYTVYNADRTVSSSGTTTVGGTEDITLAAGQYVQFLGDNAQYYDTEHSYIHSSASATVSGNVMSLISSTDYLTQTALTADNALRGLFADATQITEASDLVLPATTLSASCYMAMFRDCTSLTVGPILPALTLTDNCYERMFEGCTSLTTIHQLPATTMKESCYYQMFIGCTSLTTVPEDMLPATTLSASCYSGMFNGCTHLTSAPALPATTLTTHCYDNMFSGCTALTVAPALSATTLDEFCYSQMFSGCGLTTAPDLPATTLKAHCYDNMFNGCSGLTTTPALPATTLAASCYSQMFQGCTGLTTPPFNLPAETLADGCYTQMFQGCTSLTATPLLPATTLTDNCYKNMFQGCTSLMTATDLPAETLATGCYNQMFSGCTKLKGTIILGATTTTNFAYGENDSLYRTFYNAGSSSGTNSTLKCVNTTVCDALNTNASAVGLQTAGSSPGYTPRTD